MSLRGGSLTASAQTRMALLQCDWQGKVAEWHFGFRIQSAGVTQVVCEYCVRVEADMAEFTRIVLLR
jgi:hypothetical protein